MRLVNTTATTFAACMVALGDADALVTQAHPQLFDSAGGFDGRCIDPQEPGIADRRWVSS
jgi:hypothetical protein